MRDFRGQTFATEDDTITTQHTDGDGFVEVIIDDDENETKIALNPDEIDSLIAALQYVRPFARKFFDAAKDAD
jgi:hypothetical protein